MNSNLDKTSQYLRRFLIGKYCKPHFGIPKTSSFNYELFYLEFYQNCGVIIPPRKKTIQKSSLNSRV